MKLLYTPIRSFILVWNSKALQAAVEYSLNLSWQPSSSYPLTKLPLCASLFVSSFLRLVAFHSRGRWRKVRVHLNGLSASFYYPRVTVFANNHFWNLSWLVFMIQDVSPKRVAGFSEIFSYLGVVGGASLWGVSGRGWGLVFGYWRAYIFAPFENCFSYNTKNLRPSFWFSLHTRSQMNVCWGKKHKLEKRLEERRVR